MINEQLFLREFASLRQRRRIADGCVSIRLKPRFESIAALAKHFTLLLRGDKG